jgi:hypothetical protein
MLKVPKEYEHERRAYWQLFPKPTDWKQTPNINDVIRQFNKTKHEKAQKAEKSNS